MDLVPNKIFRAVLVYPTWGKHVCLPWKKKKIGAGFRNGYGGGIKPGETDRAAAVRELFEEAKVIIDPLELRIRAICRFTTQFENGETALCTIDVFNFRVDARHYIFRETDEMGKPEWFHKKRLPLHELMPADVWWLPRVLNGKKLFVDATYNEGQKKLLSKVIMNRFKIDRLGNRFP